jgi:hypothetical protein
VHKYLHCWNSEDRGNRFGRTGVGEGVSLTLVLSTAARKEKQGAGEGKRFDLRHNGEKGCRGSGTRVTSS